MFAYTSSFNQPLDAWDLKSCMFFEYTFMGATSFDQELCWDLNAGADTWYLFRNSGGACIDYSCCPNCADLNYPPIDCSKM